MKKYFLLLVLLLTGTKSVSAQGLPGNPGNLTPKLILDSIYRHLDPALITSGRLADRGAPLADLSHYAGLPDAPGDTADAGAFARVYHLLRSAALTPATALPDPATTFLAARHTAATDTASPVGLLVLRLPYHRLRPTALADSLVRVRGIQLFDHPGRTASPYEAREAFVAAPALSVLTLLAARASLSLKASNRTNRKRLRCTYSGGVCG